MNLKPFLRTAHKFAMENSPTLLTAVGALGVVTTSVLAARAGFRTGMDTSTQFHEEIHYGQKPVDQAQELLTRKHLAKTYWKEYIPPAVIGGITLFALIGANRIGNRRAAALATAFAISERMAEEYRQKVIEHIGDRKEEMVRSDVLKDRLDRTGTETIILGESQIVHFDAWSGRAFPATIAQIDAAVNQINYQLNQQWSATLTEFYDLLGLPKTAVSDDYGWNMDHQLDPYYTSCLLPDGKPAREIRFEIEPFQNYNKIG